MKNLFNYLKFLIFKKNSIESYYEMRNSYMIKKENFYFNLIELINKFFYPKYKINESNGVLGNVTQQIASSIASKINHDGYFIFENKLSEENVNELYLYASVTPINYLTLDKNGNTVLSDEKIIYKNFNNLSNKFVYKDYKDLFGHIISKQLFIDENFLHIANEYFKCKPIIDIVSFWWTKPLNSINETEKYKFKNTAAQMYHHDMDRIKFLKFFVFLTDVEETTGPHVMIKKSHKFSPNYIKGDGRYQDDFIENYESENKIVITGKKGSIIAVDTRSIHKGLELLEKERLIFQIQYTISLFGKPVDKYIIEDLDQVNEKYKYTYSLFCDK